MFVWYKVKNFDGKRRKYYFVCMRQRNFPTTARQGPIASDKLCNSASLLVSTINQLAVVLKTQELLVVLVLYEQLVSF